MQSPLIRSKFHDFWQFQINGDFYALNYNPKAFIWHTIGCAGFMAVVYYGQHEEIKKFSTFRDAFNYLIEKTVKRYYQSQPKNYTREERAALLRLK